jgi:two-component system cell cycle sensor histidine kinase/response regulator CckA
MDCMSESRQRRSVFFELRAVLGFVLMALLITHHTSAPSKLWLLGIAFLLSNLSIIFIPVSKFRNPTVGYGIFFLDMAVLTFFFCTVSGIQSESLLLYYLTVFMATLGADLRKSVGIAVVAAALPLGFHLSQGMSFLSDPETLMHIPLFFVTAISTGYLAQEVSIHKRRIGDLKDIQKSLESDIEVTHEDLSRSESERLAAQDRARRFQDLVQGLDAIVWEANADTLFFVFISQRAEEILGYPAEQWASVPDFWIDHIHPEDRERTMAAYRALVLAGKDHEFEYRMTAADGHLVWFRNIARVIRDAHGRALRVRGVMLDITKEKLADERDLLFMLSLDMMCVLGFDGYFKRLNPAWEKTLGYTREELQAKPYIEFVHPDDREATLAETQKLLAGQSTSSFWNRNRSKDGSYRWFLWTASPLLERQMIYGVARDGTDLKRAENELKILHDELERRVAERTAQLENAYQLLQNEVCERKQAVEALRESESRYRFLFENNPLPMWVHDLQTLRFLAVNNTAIHLYGYSHEEFLSLTIEDIRPPEDMPALLKSFSQNPMGTKEGGTCRHRKKSGAIIDVEIAFYPVHFAGRPAELVLAADVTERKRALEALRQSEASLSEAQRIAHLGNWNWDIVHDRLFWSEEIFRIFGRSPDLFDGKYNTFFNLVHPDDRELVQKTVDEALAGGKHYNLKHRVVWPRGAVRVVHAQGEVLFDPAQKPIRMVGTVQDITEQNSLEAQLLQSQKMEAVGQLAGGVAHDFNNLLTIISGYSQLLLEKSGASVSDLGHAREILKASDRAASLTRQLLAFSRRQVLAPQVLDLNNILANVDKMLRRLIGEDIDLVTHLAPDLGRVKADPGQIEQVIMNLAVNARDAMPGGGKLTLETANIDMDEAYTRTHFPAQPGRYAMFGVSDTGIGMTPETQARMFEPFFTTKGQGKGTGLGLATVYGIVKQSNGIIWVDSEPNHGSAFKIYLPLVDEAVAEPESCEPLQVLPQASETVLVVEDEIAVRSLVQHVLSSKGYLVLEASRGDEALSVCRRHQGPIHLMLTDVIMPQMSGRELATRLATVQPDMKVLFMSGYTSEGIVHHGVLERGTAFLQKPFTPNSLARKVREVIDTHDNHNASAA